MMRLGLVLFIHMTATAEPNFSKILGTLNAPVTRQTYFSVDSEVDLQKRYREEISAESAKLPQKTKRPERNRVIAKYVAEKNDKLATQLKKQGEKEIPDLAQKIYRQLTENKVSRIDAAVNYDSEGDIGFCFGRAVMAHYLLLENKIPQDRIAKIFALGQLKYGDHFWDFHMATLYETEKEWWVIDTVAGKILPLPDWMAFVSAMDPRRALSQVRFYVTDPRKFQPSYGIYRKQEFEIPALKRYFVDLFASFAK